MRTVNGMRGFGSAEVGLYVSKDFMRVPPTTAYPLRLEFTGVCFLMG